MNFLPTLLLLEELAGAATQKDAAAMYRAYLKQNEIDWQRVNEALISRWSRRGLAKVKAMAWRGVTT